jgi:hypothetical protein
MMSSCHNKHDVKLSQQAWCQVVATSMMSSCHSKHDVKLSQQAWCQVVTTSMMSSCRNKHDVKLSQQAWCQVVIAIMLHTFFTLFNGRAPSFSLSSNLIFDWCDLHFLTISTLYYKKCLHACRMFSIQITFSQWIIVNNPIQQNWFPWWTL